MNILFICTHNRCRSILSEAITNHLAKGKITAFSAGSQPLGEVHPLTLHYLQDRGFNTNGLSSKSWDEFENRRLDLVITVCDSAANEQCPVWFGNCIKIHWGLPDPSKLNGSEDDIKNAFYSVMDTIENRTRQLLAIDFNHLSKAELHSALITISKAI